MRSAANNNPHQRYQQAPPHQQQRAERARRGMGQRRRGYDDGNGNGGSGGAGVWVQRWRDNKDDEIADLQRAVQQAAETMVAIQEWMKAHDKREVDDRQQRAAVPSDIRGWISTAISIFTLLLTLYLLNQR